MKLPRASLLPARRPQLGAPRHAPSSATTFATIARRPSLPPTNFVTSPTGLLLQMSAITFGGMLIPVIRARYASSNARAESFAEDQTAEPRRGRDLSTVDESRAPPAPTPKQLLTLSTILRKRLASPTPHPFDGIFMLRQLNMVTQTPHLTLPTPSPGSLTPIPELLPEKWIWRLPATTAINSILRIINDPACQDRTRDALLPLAVTLANHAAHWDSLIWAAVLFSRGQSHSMQWERLLARVRGQTGGQGLEEEVAVMVRLDERERLPGRNEKLARWEASVEEEQGRRWKQGPAGEEEVMRSTGRRAQSRRAQAKELLSDRLLRTRVEADEVALNMLKSSPKPAPLPATLHPLSSLPQQTIDLLFIFLAQHPDRPESLTSAALSLSLARSNLALPVSPRTLVHSINMSLEHKRPDLATRLWVDMLRGVQRDRAGHNQLMRLFNKIKHQLRDSGKRYRSDMDRATFASVATMARALDREWVRARGAASMESAGGEARVHGTLNEMIDLLATFPFAPFVGDFAADTERRRVAYIHNKVDKMTRKVFRGIIEEVIDRPIYLGPLKVVVGDSPVAAFPSSPSPISRLPLTDIGYNLLITYALRQFNSSEIALRLVEKMRQQGVEPTAATHNILLDILARSSKDALALVGRNPQNAHTFPSLIKYLTSVGDWEQIEKTVFFLLPELDLQVTPTSPSVDGASLSRPHRSESTSATDFAPPPSPPADFGVSTPPPPGRSPWLYVTLLSALVAAGRTGLAERVFRSARWAAEISRQPPQVQAETLTKDLSSPSPSRTGPSHPPWTLPPQAFILMLQLYAKEARRGQALIAQGSDSSSSTFVQGWGRHAIRVFLLNEKRAELRARLGDSVDARKRVRGPSRKLDMVGTVEPFLRAEAAPIVATWELEGGSRGPELESLKTAMMSREAREALAVLFPERRLEGEEKEQAQSRDDRMSRGRKSMLEERRRTRSLGMRDSERRRRRRVDEDV